MFALVKAISMAMYDLLKSKINFRIVITGAIVTLLWFVLGWLSWSVLYGISANIMSLLPFKMLKSDGAYIFVSIVWLLGTLVTFSLLMMFFGELFARNIKERGDNRFLPLMIAGVSLVWALIIYFGFNTLYSAFEHILRSLPFEYTDDSVAAVMSIYLLYNGLIVTMAALSSLRSKYILEELRAEQYPSEKLLGGAGETFKSTIRIILIFSGVSILTFPLLFIPILNIIVQFSLWIWLYKNMFSRDVCALYCDEGERKGGKGYGWEFWVISSISSVMSFIPFINFFAPYFAEIAMFHFVMKRKDLTES
ncbi:MAG: EI24 domain-containing protein [Campylobacterota bacterium]|nr:EI24 domain-containing protein [Campylobacterota bacterium]